SHPGRLRPRSLRPRSTGMNRPVRGLSVLVGGRRGGGNRMRYKLLGPSGLRVSEVALGTMTFGEDWGWGASRDESRRIFDRFAEADGNFIDTSNNYTNGTAEGFVGEFVEGDREHFVIATKFSLSTRRDDPNAGGNHPKNMVH